MSARSTILAAVLAPLCLGGPGCREQPSARAVNSPGRSRPVTVATSVGRNLERTITVFGSFLAQERVTLSAKVPGRLKTIEVDLGSPVKAGAPVARVEPREYELHVRQAEAALAQALARLGLGPDEETAVVDPGQTSVARQARAVLDEARANRDRIASLQKQGVLSQSELDTAESAFIVAENRYQDSVEEVRQRMAMVAQRRIERDIAAQQLTDTTLVAPFDASVQERTASPGAFLNAGDAVVTLVQMNPLRLRLEVSEREAPLVLSNQVVRARVEGIDHDYVGRIVRISPAIDQQRRILLVEADIANDGSLHPGMFTRAAIVVNPSEPAVTVPAAALITFAGIEKVFTISDGKARERVITSGRRAEDWIEVVTHLKAGEEVILNPGNLQNGQPVNAAPALPASGRPTTTEAAAAASPSS